LQLHQKFNQKIIRLWEQGAHCKGRANRVPLVYAQLRKNCILFIGLNPSSTEKGLKQIVNNTPYAQYSTKQLLSWSNRPKDWVKIWVAIGSLARVRYERYFGPMISMAKSVGLPWEHVDLFLCRETRQDKVNKEYRLDQPIIAPFAQEQLSLSWQVINDLKPRVIVVANALSASLIKRFFQKYLSAFDPKKGYHSIRLGRRQVPIFFSGMLSGQRCLDKGSRERLTWHVKQAVCAGLKKQTSNVFSEGSKNNDKNL